MKTPHGMLLVALASIDRLLAPGRVILYSTVLLVAMLAILGLPMVEGPPPFTVYGSPDGGDFRAQVTGGSIALNGDMRHLYDADKQWRVQQALVGSAGKYHLEDLDVFDKPPIAAYIFLPFAAFPYLVGLALWTVCSMVMIAASVRLLWSASGRTGPPQEGGLPNLQRYGYGRILLLAFATHPVLRMLFLGQDSALALLLLVAGLRLLLARRDFAAGAVLGLGVFKPQLFLLAPVFLLLQRRWRALGAWMAVAAALAAVSVALVGPTGVPAYLQTLVAEANRSGATATSGHGWDTPSLFGLSHVLYALLPLPLAAVALVAAGGVGVRVLLSWVRNALKPARSARELRLLYAGTVLAEAIIGPHFFVYDAVVLLLPALLVYDATPESRTVHLLLVAVYGLLWSMDWVRPFLMGAPTPLLMLGAPWAVAPIVGLFVVAQGALNRRDDVVCAPVTALP